MMWSLTSAGSAADTMTITSVLDSRLNINSLSYVNAAGNNQFTYLNAGANLALNGGLSLTSGGTVRIAGGGATATAASLNIGNGSLTLDSSSRAFLSPARRRSIRP
jgi:hypothetical protein